MSLDRTLNKFKFKQVELFIVTVNYLKMLQLEKIQFPFRSNKRFCFD